MNKMHYTACPVCESREINPLLTVTDHSVSKEDFVIWQCSACALRFTQDAPDESAIGKYYQSPEYISHSNTDKGLVNRIYQSVRKRTLEKKAQLIIRHTKKEGSILDIGAGTGGFLYTMKSKGWQTVGIEPDAGARAIAENLYHLDLKETLVLPEIDKKQFDAITLWHVLEHVHQLHLYVERLKKLLTTEGRIFIAVPNYRALDAEKYKLYWAAYDVPRHLYHFTPKAMQVLMEKHGLKIIEKKRMWYDSFYISLLSSKYMKGKPRWFSAGITGLRSNLRAIFNPDTCSSIIYIVSKA